MKQRMRSMTRSADTIGEPKTKPIYYFLLFLYTKATAQHVKELRIRITRFAERFNAQNLYFFSLPSSVRLLLLFA